MSAPNREQRRAEKRAAGRQAKLKGVALRVTRRVWADHATRVAASSYTDSQILGLDLDTVGNIDALARGGALMHHMERIAAAANISVLLTEHGYGLEYVPEFEAAQIACVAVVNRSKETGVFAATEQEMRSMLLMSDLHRAQLELRPTMGVMQAVLAALKRRAQAGHTID